jgi:hypothetical protein
MRRCRLSDEELARIPEFIDKWTAIGLSTTPVDQQRAEPALRHLYASAGLLEPKIIWVPCPMTAILSAILYATIRASGHPSRAHDDRKLAEIAERVMQRPLTMTAAPSAYRPMHLAVERAVSVALGHTSRIWSGFDVALAINQTRRATFDRVLNRAVDDTVRQRLHTRLVTPIRAGLGILTGLLQPALNLVGYGVARIRIRHAGLAYSGAPLWAPDAARIDYAQRVLGIPFERGFLEAVESCGLYWMLDGICFAAERPTHINRDVAGRLHCEVGPGVAYPSGWSWWHWHGVRVPQNIIEEPETVTVETIKHVRSAALRRVIIERYRHGEATHGVAAYLRDAGGVRLDHDAAFGTLWRLAVAGEPTLMVEVVNHSPEPDGACRHFFLQIHPELRPILKDGNYGMPQPPTARNAVASTFGLSGAEYRPGVET